MAFKINKIFKSLQGEGPAIGFPATFIRFSGCNLCCTYCDTEHESGSEWQLPDIIKEVKEGPLKVVLTGGEPLLAGAQLVPLAKAITETGRSLDIETNGTISPPPALPAFVSNYVISPKLSNSGNPAAARQLASNLPPGPLKFVVDNVSDLQEVKQIARTLPGREIIIMPLGTDPETMITKMKSLCAAVKLYGWRLLPRLQVLMQLE
jgi:organic radical activating enzyme